MKYKGQDPYITYTPKELVTICENCPYADCKSGVNGCRYFMEQRNKFLQSRKKVGAK